METKSVQKQPLNASAITLLFMMVYMVSYMTRVNFSAIVAEIEQATETSKELLSLSLTGSFVTYGVGQIVSGVCGDRFSPKKLVSMGLSVTIAMNLLLPFCVNPYQMMGVWSFNGFAQAFMWPPLVRLMSVQLTEEEYKKAAVKISWGISLGSIAVYLLAPAIILCANWKAVFWLSSVVGVIGLVFWTPSAPRPPRCPEWMASVFPLPVCLSAMLR